MGAYLTIVLFYVSVIVLACRVAWVLRVALAPALLLARLPFSLAFTLTLRLSFSFRIKSGWSSRVAQRRWSLAVSHLIPTVIIVPLDVLTGNVQLDDAA